jgi:hypothetical protein
MKWVLTSNCLWFLTKNTRNDHQSPVCALLFMPGGWLSQATTSDLAFAPLRRNSTGLATPGLHAREILRGLLFVLNVAMSFCQQDDKIHTVVARHTSTWSNYMPTCCFDTHVRISLSSCHNSKRKKQGWKVCPCVGLFKKYTWPLSTDSGTNPIWIQLFVFSRFTRAHKLQLESAFVTGSQFF